VVAGFFRARATGRNLTIVFVALATVGASFGVYFTPAYQSVSGGLVPFDMQFPLTSEVIGIQLALLTPDSPASYTRFMIADTVFPPLAGLCSAILWAWLLNLIGWRWLDALYGAGLWLLPFLAAACDLTENVLFHRIVAAAPRALPETIDTAVAVHGAKLRFLSATLAISAALLVIGAGTWLRRKARAR
jgi:hypothetical protein